MDHLHTGDSYMYLDVEHTGMHAQVVVSLSPVPEWQEILSKMRLVREMSPDGAMGFHDSFQMPTRWHTIGGVGLSTLSYK